MGVTMQEAVGITKTICKGCQVEPKQVLDIIYGICVVDIAKGNNIKEMSIGICTSGGNDSSFVAFLQELGVTVSNCTPLPMVQQYRILCDICYMVLKRKQQAPPESYMATGIKSLDARGYSEADGVYADQAECERLLRLYESNIPKEVEGLHVYYALEGLLESYDYGRINWKQRLAHLTVAEPTTFLGKGSGTPTYTEAEFRKTVYLAYLDVLQYYFDKLGKDFSSSLVACYPNVASRMEGRQLHGLGLTKNLPYKVRQMYQPFFCREYTFEVVDIMRLVLFIECVRWGKNADADKFVVDIRSKIKTGGNA